MSKSNGKTNLLCGTVEMIKRIRNYLRSSDSIKPTCPICGGRVNDETVKGRQAVYECSVCDDGFVFAKNGEVSLPQRWPLW